MPLYELFEILMLIFFGCSWPVNLMKSYRVRTAKGKSPVFLALILIGYGCGIAAKLVNPAGYHWYVLAVYILNSCFVIGDLLLYFRNRRLDRLAEG